MSAVDELVAAGSLGRLAVRVSAALGRLVDERDEAVLLAAALACQATLEGSSWLDLADAPARFTRSRAGEPLDVALPSVADWVTALSRSPLVGGADVATPLVLDERGLVALRRAHDTEREVAQALRALAAGRLAVPAVDAARRALVELFPSDTSDAAQRYAAQRALPRRLLVVTGGPGTGKTTTVLRLAALVALHERAAGAPPPRVLLLAPTGKAASRLAEAVARGKAALRVSDEVRVALPDSAETIHRALGMGRDGVPRRDARRPLPAELVVVDEASMVDLELMAALLRAVPRAARLVLLGDRHQLASVEAGAVLADICAVPRGLSTESAMEHQALWGEAPPLGSSVGVRAGSVGECVVELQRSHRFDDARGIGRLARAVVTGDVAAAQLALAEEADLALLAPPPRGGLAAPALAVVQRALEAVHGAADGATALASLGRVALLAAHREGPAGLAALREAVSRGLAEDARKTGPVLITRSDRALDLFNGDVGVVRAERGRRVAAFPGPAGRTRTFPVERLPPHESAVALTIHKSQGSEYDEVVVVLPRVGSPLLTRELLYTALTRARHRVWLQLSDEALAAAIETVACRATRLTELLMLAD